MKKTILYILLIVALFITGAVWYAANSNNYKREGSFKISKNKFPIQIHRDENGIAYVIAENKEDVIRGQAFVLAQDRLFQIEFYRAIIKGEAASLLGNSMLQSDIKMQVLNLVGNAKKSYPYLDKETKEMLTWYCEGFNEYLKVGKDEFPIELSLLGIKPKPLTPEEIVSITHFIGLFHSQNLEDEVLSLNLAASTDKALELLPLSINLDRTKKLSFTTDSVSMGSLNRNDNSFKALPTPFLSYPKLGSNNWAISGKKSKSGKPILSNDPHVDARMLPGTFYPIGLMCPEFKAVGIATPGIPGLLSGRNEFVSFGVTNAYGDSQDLFIEETEGKFYRYKDKKTPFEKRKIIIKVKDSLDVALEIRATKNGPVISDFAVFNILTDDVVSLRWSLAETKSNSIGFDRLLETKNVAEFRDGLKGMDNMFFNYAIADVHGSIAHQSTGLVPIRKNNGGEVPTKGNEDDTWLGFIPKEELPNMVNPERGWIGTANHDTRPDEYPYYYSNHFSPYYRYQRITEILSENKKFAADDLWTMIFDVKNMQAELFTPVFIAALAEKEETKELATILAAWTYQEDINSIGASVYNVLYNELLYLVMNDELPDDIEDMYWENVYYWNQKVDGFIASENNFIDNINTPEKETLKDLIVEAGIKTQQLLTERLGDNQENWTWGKIHTVRFFSPLRKEGFGSDLLGAEVFAKAGSNQTLNRGGFIKNREREFDTSWFSSFRMVADMNDDEKMIGILSGGSAARIFHPYYKSQLEKWKTGEWIPYWISKEKVLEHSEYELILE
ncbi:MULTISPECIES: penicillin acylase family protein [unclassified Polaribacter]|uniref:penicillin acylase family protein n=1 Tax=unclassified Polaribacter TaxID=196858 RepID=UPI0011BE7085|nr:MULTISPECIES: penicillin acylase family protein [unclassified Polaribacter]TXD51792.1 penicillin acylase family protein [Polaribacter sp. IC063]TXD59154.1 penicillin acylase family protein [Polaribacter sp. IC066]